MSAWERHFGKEPVAHEVLQNKVIKTVSEASHDFCKQTGKKAHVITAGVHKWCGQDAVQWPFHKHVRRSTQTCFAPEHPLLHQVSGHSLLLLSISHFPQINGGTAKIEFHRKRTAQMEEIYPCINLWYWRLQNCWTKPLQMEEEDSRSWLILSQRWLTFQPVWALPPVLLSTTMPFYSGFMLRMRILKSNAMSAQEVNHAIFSFPAPAKVQNATVLGGEQFSQPSCLQ